MCFAIWRGVSTISERDTKTMKTDPAPSQPKVFIIILTWNRLSDTLECLESVKKIVYPNYEIMVVDNGSTDKSAEAIAAKYPEITLIKNESNLGYAAGNNKGIEKALHMGCDYVFILNNDTTVDAACLDELVKTAEADPRIGAAGSKIYLHQDPSVVWYAGGDICFREAISVTRGWFKRDHPSYDRPGEVSFITGCAMLAKRTAIEAVGLLDPEYVSYLEDTDWCWRMAQKGFKLAYVPGGKVYHKVSQSFGSIPYNEKSMYLMGKNAVRFMKKYGTFIRWLKFIFFFWLSVLYALPRETARGNLKAVSAKVRGLLDGIKGSEVKQ
jgi:hypothetical protein